MSAQSKSNVQNKMKKSKLKLRNKEKKNTHTQHRTEPLNLNVGEFQ